MTRKPHYYKTPLRSRADIVAFIFAATDQRSYDYCPHPFCFNVKAYGTNFDFEHLLGIFREMEGDPLYTHDGGWLEATRERFEEHENHLWEWGIESACSHFVGWSSTGEPESDCYTHLWDGTEIDVKYSFEGRSGGWLSINRFQGHDFTDREYDCQSLRQLMESSEFDFQTLRQLYQLVVMLKHDVSDPEREIEHGAAWALFVNVCADIPQPDAIQRNFDFMEEPACT